MRLRIWLFEPNDAISGSLQMFLEELGHEVILAGGDAGCPHYRSDGQCCSRGKPCVDAVILGQYLAHLRGIDLIERRLRGGCKVLAANMALICLPWSDRERGRAEALGCRYFETPLRLTELAEWLELAARRIDPQRQLTPRHRLAGFSCRAGAGS